MNTHELIDQVRTENENASFDILNTSSDINMLYRLKAPFQVTYEFCSGINENDFLNVLSLSPNGPSYTQEPIGLHNYIYHHMAPHFHDYYEFLIVLDGALYQQIEGKEYLYPEGSCCLINRNLRHKEIFDQASKILFLGFSAEYMTELLRSDGAGNGIQEGRITDTALSRFIMEDIQSPGRKAYLDFIPTCQNKRSLRTLHRLSEALIDTMMFPKFGSSHITQGLLCYILQYLSSQEDYHCSLMELSSDRDYLLFARVEHLLEENDGRISREELSKILNYSGDYLNRIVKKYSGMSLHEYGMKICMKKAANLLAKTSRSVSEIASDLQFTNRTYFYKLFTAQYGITPREYRAKKQKAAGTFLLP